MERRFEYDYRINGRYVEEFLRRLNKLSVRKATETPFNESVYLENTEHETPIGVFVRLRSYCGHPWKDKMDILSDRPVVLEVKREGSDRITEEVRYKTRLSEALHRINDRRLGFLHELPLIPYAANNYRRQHFVLGGGQRVTVDTDMSAYLLTGSNCGEAHCDDKNPRVKIKLPVSTEREPAKTNMEKLLESVDAMPAISKKDIVYNVETSLMKKRGYNLPKDTDTEMEAKFLLNPLYQRIFHDAKSLIGHGRVKGFSLLRRFPYTLLSGKITTYVLRGDEYIRISDNGFHAKISRKEDKEVMPDGRGLHCIVRRTEVTTKEKADEFEDEPRVQVYKRRKNFLVQNDKSDAVYCISIDRSFSGENGICLFEIERVMRSPSESEVRTTVADIAALASRMHELYPRLRPTTLDKLEWIKSLHPHRNRGSKADDLKLQRPLLQSF